MGDVVHLAERKKRKIQSPPERSMLEFTLGGFVPPYRLRLAYRSELVDLHIARPYQVVELIILFQTLAPSTGVEIRYTNETGDETFDLAKLIKNA